MQRPAPMPHRGHDCRERAEFPTVTPGLLRVHRHRRGIKATLGHRPERSLQTAQIPSIRGRVAFLPSGQAASDVA
jgi:hypothetical protein